MDWHFTTDISCVLYYIHVQRADEAHKELNMTTPTKYILDKQRDVDADDDGYILNLPYGFRFNDDVVHVRGFDTMAELRWSAKHEVIQCGCADCAKRIK